MDKTVQSNRALDRIISSIGELPATPIIVSALMGLTSDVNTDIEKICQTIMTDQSLTARVLRLSNSSFYGRSKEVSTLREAIVLLGFKTLRSLIVATSTHSIYQGISDSQFREKLWEHTLATALAARLIARAIRHPHAEEAFIAGLMHDIGKLVLMQKAPVEYRKIVKAVEETSGRFLEIEDEIFGFNHTDVGLLLLHKWAFPPALGNAVFEHHYPFDMVEHPVPLSFLVNLANFMAKNVNVGFNDFHVTDVSQLPSVIVLKLDREKLEQIETGLIAQYQTERELFSMAT